MLLFLENSTVVPKTRLRIEIVSEKGRRSFNQTEISNPGTSGNEYETFEGGICLSESAWPTPEVVVVLVKNCLGYVTLVAITFNDGRIIPGDKYSDSIRNVLQKRYRLEFSEKRQDPLQWINGQEANLAYLSRRRKSGELKDD